MWIVIVEVIGNDMEVVVYAGQRSTFDRVAYPNSVLKFEFVLETSVWVHHQWVFVNADYKHAIVYMFYGI